MNPTSKHELLMPAGDFGKMRFAFAYGADAVYAGVPIYSLRARENAFRKDTLREAIAYAHARGKRVYLTMNIYAHNSKVSGFLDSFCEMADLGPDGFIMSDIGLINRALKLRPDATVHLSTQANATNFTAVEFWRDIGIKRVILSRELSLKEIARIRDEVPDIELEAFVHGAVCIAYSGRCLISNYMNHRDANQGTCTNSCRWEYNLAQEKGSLRAVEAQQQPAGDYQQLAGTYYVTEPTRAEERFELDEDEHGTYMMNSKDLCAIELLQDVADAGVCSFKVEGRTKSLFYVAVVSRAYRRAIDDMAAGRPFNPDNLREVMSAASRTMMTGFYLKRPEQYGENVEDGDVRPLTHRFAGSVKDYDPQTGLATISVKNKLSVGDRIEWITPNQSVESFVKDLVKKNGAKLESASGGLECCIPAPFEVDEFTLLRQPLDGGLGSNQVYSDSRSALSVLQNI